MSGMSISGGGSVTPAAVAAALAGQTVNGLTVSPGTLKIDKTGGESSTFGGTPTVLATALTNGGNTQLADITRDYMVYFQIGTAGTAFSLTVGGNSIMSGAAVASGQQISFRVPAGAFVSWSAVTATLASQIAIGC